MCCAAESGAAHATLPPSSAGVLAKDARRFSYLVMPVATGMGDWYESVVQRSEATPPILSGWCGVPPWRLGPIWGLDPHPSLPPSQEGRNSPLPLAKREIREGILPFPPRPASTSFTFMWDCEAATPILSGWRGVPPRELGPVTSKPLALLGVTYASGLLVQDPESWRLAGRSRMPKPR